MDSASRLHQPAIACDALSVGAGLIALDVLIAAYAETGQFAWAVQSRPALYRAGKPLGESR